jgi:thiamine kinase-like enzyme
MNFARIDPTIDSTTDVPIDVLESILREHIVDGAAVITTCDVAPFANQGTNDSSTFYRVTLSWTLANPSTEASTTWIIKHWKAGGMRDGRLGLTQPLDVLAWEQGRLRRDALPRGIVVPFIGARRSPDNSEAWLAMADVSTELSAYSRMSLTADQAISRTRIILARLARLHALWERPEQQAKLQACSWLRRPDLQLWDMAATYAHALGRTPMAPPGASAPPVWEGLGADLDAFLDARPADERRLWEYLLIDRSALVEGLTGYPQTLLHNDLDDRNIGLRSLQQGSGIRGQGLGTVWHHNAAPDPATSATVLPTAIDNDNPDLVLIDWEWIGVGPAALDVANIVQRAPIMIAPGAPLPEIIWGEGFADDYFARYRAAGGRCVDAAAWRRSYGLALVAQGVTQMPFIHGSMRRAMRGDAPLPQIIGVPEDVIRQNLRAGLPMMERMEQRVIDAARGLGVRG